MPFVTTNPAALAAAAATLQGIGSAMTAQNAAAAAPTTGVVPAAADEVSALQATLFSAYGKLYQQVAAEATAIQEAFVQTLRTSADSYDGTETANAAAGGGSSGSFLQNLLNLLTGNGQFTFGASTLGNTGIIGAMQASNFGSAASDLLQLGSSGFLAPGALAPGSASTASAISTTSTAAVLAGTVDAAGPAASAGMPASAGIGQASSIGRLSVPPSWAGQVASAPSAAPATLSGAGWTTAAPHGAPVAAMPAGAPALASAEREGFGFGRPRYGVKPTVMPRPAVV